MAKITAKAWRRIELRQTVEIEIEVPDFIFNDAYAPEVAVEAYIRTNEENLNWQSNGHRQLLSRGVDLTSHVEEDEEDRCQK